MTVSLPLLTRSYLIHKICCASIVIIDFMNVFFYCSLFSIAFARTTFFNVQKILFPISVMNSCVCVCVHIVIVYWLQLFFFATCVVNWCAHESAHTSRASTRQKGTSNGPYDQTHWTPQLFSQVFWSIFQLSEFFARVFNAMRAQFNCINHCDE